MYDAISFTVLTSSNSSRSGATLNQLAESSLIEMDQMLETVMSWDFAPYPVMPAAAAQRITTLICARCDYDASPLAGAIGVVYVPVQSFMVEAYLQLVLINPRHRQQGVGRKLLAFTVQYLAEESLRVMRIRLHTMRDTLVTRVALNRRANPSSSTTTITAPTDVSLSLDERAVVPVSGEKANEAAATTTIATICAMIGAWTRVYESMGFKPRRYIDRYYSGGADAVEYVLEAASLRGYRKPTLAAATLIGQKRNRE